MKLNVKQSFFLLFMGVIRVFSVQAHDNPFKEKVVVKRNFGGTFSSPNEMLLGEKPAEDSGKNSLPSIERIFPDLNMEEWENNAPSVGQISSDSVAFTPSLLTTTSKFPQTEDHSAYAIALNIYQNTQKIQQQDPQNPDWLMTLSYYEYNFGHYEQARHKLLTILEMDRDNKVLKRNCLYLMTWIEWKTGHKEEAKKAYKDLEIINNNLGNSDFWHEWFYNMMRKTLGDFKTNLREME